MIEIIETKDDDELDQYMCFSAAVSEVIIILYTWAHRTFDRRDRICFDQLM